MSNFNKVKTFMETFGQEVKIKPSFSTDKVNSLRFDLIRTKRRLSFDFLTKGFHESFYFIKI